MLNYNIAKAREAVQYLADSPYMKHHVKKLRNTVVRPRSLPFKGELECLNELLVVGRQSLVALENLITVAEFKRSGPDNYMKAFMQAKRARDRKMVMVEEVSTGRKLTLDERIDVLRRAHTQWNRDKAVHVERCAKEYREQCSKEPAWMHTNAFIKDFWMHKDMELDVMLEKAQQFVAHRGAPPTKYEVVPKPRVVRAPRNPAMADKLSLAIENRLKK